MIFSSMLCGPVSTTAPSSPKLTNSRSSFDHLVGAGEQGLRNVQAERQRLMSILKQKFNLQHFASIAPALARFLGALVSPPAARHAVPPLQLLGDIQRRQPYAGDRERKWPGPIGSCGRQLPQWQLL